MVNWNRRSLSLFSTGWVVICLAYFLLVIPARAAEPPGFPVGPLSGLFFPESDSFEYEIREALPTHSQDPDILENRLRASVLLPSSSSNIWSIHQTVDSFH